MADTDALTIRELRTTDLPDLMALVEEAGWNQTEADWRRMLAIGRGRGIVDDRDRIVGSAMAMGYGGRIGWIGMVLVAGAHRRRGLARRLMAATIEGLTSDGLTPGLDATPAGEAVYGTMGFSGSERLTRWRRGPVGEDGDAPTLARVDAADLDWIAQLDAQSFGAAREDLLAGYLGNGTSGGWKIGERAFLLERVGRTARHLGPLVAGREDDAVALLTGAAAARSGPLLIDVPDRHARLATLLTASGFQPERPFLRMYLGRDTPPGRPDRQMASAGPELG